MNKAVLSDRIYMTNSEELQKRLELELTYKFPMRSNPGAFETYQDIIAYKGNNVSIPIGRQDLIPEDYIVVDKRRFAPISFGHLNYTLRAYQEDAVKAVQDSYILKAYTGSGKSVMGVYIAANFRQKTLIIVHTVLLREQWCKEIKAITGKNPGIIGGGLFSTKESIVVGNIQTIRNNIPKIRDVFGTVILDEVQYVAATTFNNVMDKMKARYKIGMSATLNRKDQKGILIKDYFSTNLYEVPDIGRLKPTVIMCYIDVPLDSRPTIPWATKLNKLYENEKYFAHIVALSKTLSDKGYKVLVVADRVKFLQDASGATDGASLITGKVEDRAEILKQVKDTPGAILYGTTSIFKEGFDEPSLDALIIGTPINNDPMLEQLIGRVLRPHPDKNPPVVWDLCLKGPQAKRQASARRGFYIRSGFTIEEIHENT